MFNLDEANEQILALARELAKTPEQLINAPVRAAAYLNWRADEREKGLAELKERRKDDLQQPRFQKHIALEEAIIAQMRLDASDYAGGVRAVSTPALFEALARTVEKNRGIILK